MSGKFSLKIISCIIKKFNISTDKCTEVLGKFFGLQKTTVKHLPYSKHSRLHGFYLPQDFEECDFYESFFLFKPICQGLKFRTLLMITFIRMWL